MTRHCLRPNFRKISTTISIGVWSVTVKGLISSMLLSFKGRGLSAGSDGVCWAKQTLELPTIPSCFFLALSLRKRGKGLEKEQRRKNLGNAVQTNEINTTRPQRCSLGGDALLYALLMCLHSHLLIPKNCQCRHHTVYHTELAILWILLFSLQ